ncbi:hypothetical protein ACFODL_08945 [Phenylobacterium terrae]
MLDQDRRVCLDLRQCQRISPEMAPFLAAEFARLRYLKGAEAITGLSPEDEHARWTLHAMGFFEVLGLLDPRSLEEGDDTEVIYRIVSGTALDGAITKELTDAMGEAMGLPEEAMEPVQKALNEALENISEHAYFDTDRLYFPAEANRWWICGVTLADTKSAYVLACDLGMTIPATIPETAKRRGPLNVAALANFLKDGGGTQEEKLLAAAFEEGVTRRPDGKGGRGLGKMAQLMGGFEKASLTVWSGEAAATMSKASPKVQTERLPLCFPGTYILWHLQQGTTE